MLKLTSPKWHSLSHAYGTASDVPKLISAIRTASLEEWRAVVDELMSAILHQGDVYTATYAAVPHLVRYAEELGPCSQSDELLSYVAYAARGGTGPEVPGFLEEGWEDAQERARDLILERFVFGEVTESWAADLIFGLLDLSAEPTWAEHIRNWVWGYSIETACLDCGHQFAIFWDKDRPRQELHADGIGEIRVIVSSEAGVKPEIDMEFDDESMVTQIIGLAESTSYVQVVAQIRCFFGYYPCPMCGNKVQLWRRGPTSSEEH